MLCKYHFFTYLDNNNYNNLFKQIPVQKKDIERQVYLIYPCAWSWVGSELIECYKFTPGVWCAVERHISESLSGLLERHRKIPNVICSHCAKTRISIYNFKLDRLMS